MRSSLLFARSASRLRLPAFALAMAALLSPGLAFAKESPMWEFHKAVAVRYGTVSLDDSYIQGVFGKQNDVLKVEYDMGWRLVEIGASAGFGQETGFLQTSDGATSDEHDMLSLYPLEGGLLVRLDFFNEQWLVPTGGIGANLWMWRENWYVPDSGTDDDRNGAKLGWHYSVGGMLRLDAFDRKAASELQATTGIDDTFIVCEYRHNYMPTGADELHMSGWEVTGGLRFDF